MTFARCVSFSSLFIAIASLGVPARVSLAEDDVKVHDVVGRVLLPDGSAAADAAIYVLAIPEDSYTLPTHPLTSRTDEHGRFVLQGVEDGSYQVWAELGKYTSLEKQLRGVRIQVNDEIAKNAVELRLHEGCSYRVRVIERETDRPIEGASITFGWPDIAREFTTGSDGIANIEGLASNEWYFVVRTKNYALRYEKYPAKPLGSTTELLFELEPGCEIVGTMRDDEGNPIENAKVSGMENFSSRGEMVPGLGSTETDSQGQFRFGPIAPNWVVDLWAFKSGHYAWKSTIRMPQEPEPVELAITMARLAKEGNCAMQVVDRNGDPIQGVQVSNSGDGNDGRSAITDENGYCKLQDVLRSNGQVSAYLQAKGFKNKSVELKTSHDEDPEPMVVVLERGRTLKGRLLDPIGKPLANVRVIAESDMFPRTRSDEQGRFELSGLSDNAAFTIYPPGPLEPIVMQRFPLDTEEEVEIEFEPESVLRMQVLDDVTGKPLSSYLVKLQQVRQQVNRLAGRPVFEYRMNSKYSQTGIEVSDPEGNFRIGQLQNGLLVHAIISAPGYETLDVGPISVQPESQSEIVVVRIMRSTTK